MQTIQEETFWGYEPKHNHLTPDEDAPWDGCMFETYGPELEFVRQQPNQQIWTLVEADGRWYICTGYHRVNRVGYFVTEKPWHEDLITVRIL